jgi:hypothetical protein
VCDQIKWIEREIDRLLILKWIEWRAQFDLKRMFNREGREKSEITEFSFSFSSIPLVLLRSFGGF